MTLILKNIPYISALSFTDDLMFSLVSQTEATITSEIEKFKKEGPETFEIEISKEEGIYSHIEHYHGLSDQDVDLNDIFLEYFPSLNRRSAFQTIYGIYEVEIQNLCRSYQAKLGGKKLDTCDGSGIVKIHNFIKSHFPKLTNANEWKSINELRILRNNCVHNNGCIYKKKAINEINTLIESVPDLFHHDGIKDHNGQLYSNGSPKRIGRNIVLERGSLQYVIEAFRSYVKLINSAYMEKCV